MMRNSMIGAGIEEGDMAWKNSASSRVDSNSFIESAFSGI